MLWQDLVFTVGEALFLVGLLPVLRNPAARLPFMSSAMNAAVLASYAVATFSLGMVLASVIAAGGTVAWGFLAVFRRLPQPARSTRSAPRLRPRGRTTGGPGAQATGEGGAWGQESPADT